MSFRIFSFYNIPDFDDPIYDHFGWMIFHFLIVQVHFVLFPYLMKYYHIMLIIVF